MMNNPETETATQPETWNGLPMRTQELCELVGCSRVTLWRDAQAGLLKEIGAAAPSRSRWTVWSEGAVRRYLKRKYPQVLGS